MRLRNAVGACLVIQAASVASISSAESFDCPDTGITVEFTTRAHADLVCEAAETTMAGLASCRLPSLPPALRIEVVDEVQQGCVGLYHCGKASIELLSPTAMAERRDPDSAFGFLDAESYFKSVVVHELTHSATVEIPCPIKDCIVADEFVAYAMQIRSLSRETSRAFSVHADGSIPANSGDLNLLMLNLAPDRFARSVWWRLMRSDDPCGLLRNLAERTVLLDRERFE